MRHRLLFLPGIVLVSLLALGLLRSHLGLVRAQNPSDELRRLVNEARLSQGLHPYVISRELTIAAQRHSEDMAATGNISHTGSDGSSSTQRILEAGYGVYEFGLLASENIYGGTGGARDPFDTWMAQSGARSNVLHDKYREVGVGVASDAQGRTFWTLSVGAQPNVLPVLVNDGATTVETITVTLRLVPENVVPEGRGTAMGQPIEYRASTSSQFLDAQWAPWAENVDFVLDESPGQQTVYVQLRDAAGRTTVSQVNVTLGGLEAPITPTETAGVQLTATPAQTPTVTATSLPGISLTPSPPAVASPTDTPIPTVTASATPQPSATTTPSPSPTITPTPTTVPTTVAAPTATSSPPPTATATSPPPPTALATSPPSPTAVATSPPPPTAAFLEETTAPIRAIRPGTAEEMVEEESETSTLGARLAPWALGLQIVALMLGVYVALRRPREAEDGE